MEAPSTAGRNLLRAHSSIILSPSSLLACYEGKDASVGVQMGGWPYRDTRLRPFPAYRLLRFSDEIEQRLS